MASRESANRREREKSADAREIGPLPKVANKTRRAKGLKSLREFLEIYFPAAFPRKWCGDHLRVIEKIETSAVRGGLFALAMPRGAGKTTICERAAIWVAIKGLHRFITVICANKQLAVRRLKNIKIELWQNDRLLADFPEVCFPIRCLNNEPRRCQGQTCEGQLTSPAWGQCEIVLPRVPKKYKSMASGAVLSATGITSSNLRGQSICREDGSVDRPSFVLIDDPQDRRSAKSDRGNETREQIVSGDVLGMAGPGQKISAVMPCTVIQPGDMADRLLNRKLHPEWKGERTKLIYDLPKNIQLWEKYWDLRASALREEREPVEANQLYAKSREAMDEGARIAWKERFDPDELSAIQHAMNLRFRDPESFASEYQNEPLPPKSEGQVPLTADQISSKLHGLARGLCPVETSHLTAFIDVQKTCLFWLVAAWSDRFSGWVVDYGAWPEQQRSWWTLAEANPTLDKLYPGRPLEGTLYAGLEGITAKILGSEWARDGKAVQKVERCLIDSGWGESTDVVFQFCRQSPHSAVLMASKGMGISASMKPLNEYEKKPGDRVGLHWRVPAGDGRRAVRHVVYDANYWKSFVFSRLAAGMGSPGSLSLFGNDARAHRLIADHLTSEFAVKTFGRQREVTEWKIKPARPDNHWLDCLVGSAVAASMAGASVLEAVPRKTRQRRVSYF